MAAYLARFNYEIVKPVRSATRYPSPTQRSAPSRTQDERIARSVMTNTDYVGVTTHGTRIAAARLAEGATNRQRPQRGRPRARRRPRRPRQQASQPCSALHENKPANWALDSH